LVFSTHSVAGLLGGLLVGILGNRATFEYIGTDKDVPGVSITGLLRCHQLVLQLHAALFTIAPNVVGTYIIRKFRLAVRSAAWTKRRCLSATTRYMVKKPTRWTAIGQRPGAEVPAGPGVAAGDQGKPSGLR
jgi:hypothetical protein